MANALSRPVQPDDILAEIVGSRPLPRTQIVKKLWAYIKKHDLQAAGDRRIIVADDRLIDLFNGKKRVNMMQLGGYIADHVR